MPNVLHQICAAEGGSAQLQYHIQDLEWVTIQFVLVDDGQFGGRLESLDDGSKYNILVNMSDWLSNTADQRVPLYRESILDEPIKRTILPPCPDQKPSRWIVASYTSENSY